MALLDLRPQTQASEPTDEQEVKEEDTTSGDSSNSEQNEEVESAIEDDTSEKTVVEEAPTKDAEEEKSEKKPWDVDALKAERDRITNELKELRAERRKAREESKQDLFVEADRATDLSDINEEDVKLIEKVLRAKGYVRRDDVERVQHAMTYKEKLDAFKNEWLSEHKEYLPENDVDDSKWNALNRIMEDFGFRSPTKPEQVKDLLEFAHRKLSPQSSVPIKSKATIEAAKEKLSSSSKGTGGNSKTATQGRGAKVDASLFQGFTDEELKELSS